MAIDGYRTAQQLADHMGWSLSWVRQIIRDGRLAAQQIGRSYLISDQALADYLATRRPRGWQPGRPRKHSPGT